MGSFKRKIFYLSGFDPRGVRFYHQLYAREAKLFSTLHGDAIEVSPRKRLENGNTQWVIRNDSADAETTVTFLSWDDIIRRHWIRNPLALLQRSVAAYSAFLRNLDWSRTLKFPRGSQIAFYYPGVSAIALPILMTVLLWLLFATFLSFPGSLIAALLTGVAAAAFIIRKIQSLWLLRFVIFNDSFGSNEPDPAMEARLDEMARDINAALAEPWDEILFVTHSNGSILSVPIMSRLLAFNSGRMPDNFALVTLGSCIPLLGCRQDSTRFHDQLQHVAYGYFTWLDLGSMTDGACIPLVDPCATCITRGDTPRYVMSPRWFKYCDPATYKARRRNKAEVHFDYLRTFDRLSPLDYIAVTSRDTPLPKSIAAFRAENEL